MALQSPFFNNNKREGETGYQPPRTGTTPTTSGASSASSMSTSSASNAPLPVPAPVTGAESKLTVGPNIKLKGVEITDCDTLVVEGSVEATMDSRVIQISERGAFKGSAEIDIAEIRGVFDGNLTVRQKLTIFATGKVTGRVRYGKIVIEEGGQLSGEIEAGASAVRAAGTAAGNAARPELQQVRTA